MAAAAFAVRGVSNMVIVSLMRMSLTVVVVTLASSVTEPTLLPRPFSISLTVPEICSGEAVAGISD